MHSAEVVQLGYYSTTQWKLLHRHYVMFGAPVGRGKVGECRVVLSGSKVAVWHILWSRI